MSAKVTLPTQTAAPTGAEADWQAPSNLLLLFIIRMLIVWAQDLVTSLRARTETTDLTDVIRDFGTTDIAFIIERITTGLERLRALEAKVLGHDATLDTDPQLETTGAAASLRKLSAPQPAGLTPEDLDFLSFLMSKPAVAEPTRATGPPRTGRSARKSPRGPSILLH